MEINKICQDCKYSEEVEYSFKCKVCSVIKNKNKTINSINGFEINFEPKQQQTRLTEEDLDKCKKYADEKWNTTNGYSHEDFLIMALHELGYIEPKKKSALELARNHYNTIPDVCGLGNVPKEEVHELYNLYEKAISELELKLNERR